MSRPVFSHLQDLDFADDIAILSSTISRLQEKSDDLNKNSKKNRVKYQQKEIQNNVCQLESHKDN